MKLFAKATRFVFGSIVLVLLGSTAIVVHELGHAVAAWSLGLGVRQITIGMGPRIWGYVAADFDISVKAIPLGGETSLIYSYTAEMLSPEAKRKLAMYRPKFWAMANDPSRQMDRADRYSQALVYLAGPLVNLLIVALIGRVVRARAKALFSLHPEFRKNYLEPTGFFAMAMIMGRHPTSLWRLALAFSVVNMIFGVTALIPLPVLDGYLIMSVLLTGHVEFSGYETATMIVVPTVALTFSIVLGHLTFGRGLKTWFSKAGT